MPFLAMCQPPPSPHPVSFWHLETQGRPCIFASIVGMGTRPALGAQCRRSPGTRGHLLLAPLETQMETQNPVPHQIPTPGGAAKAEGVILPRARGVTCSASKWGSGSFLWVTPSTASPGFHRFWSLDILPFLFLKKKIISYFLHIY